MSVRHTTSLVMRALFDTLGNIRGKTFLELFAGSGKIGEEALKRGAKEVFFVEIDPRMVREISKKVARDYILCMDYKKAIKKLYLDGKKFDIIFADPPYGMGFPSEILRVLEEVPLLKDDGLLVIERFFKEDFEPGSWKLLKERRYGDTILSYLYKGV
ncbi:MAG: RsmD family RNA methyltransferase [Synergistetes bacterium]|nr:RsmD family RNA methyltransferase [Synergistota bacterium]MCX8127190.1 RsmD family RNA methyltransferase [Synergistota bacterium]MDW8191924.1 RsmD family RNA methyltransferase [Synergistota bacterium]